MVGTDADRHVTGLWIAVLVAVLGGLGAVGRYLLETLIGRPGRRPYPLGTLLINLTGSALLGLLAGAVARGRLPSEALVILGSGLLGGYTTFSSASQETVELLQDHRYGAALGHGAGMLSGAILLAAVGLAVGLSL